jgi:hypothetical protein
MARATAAAKKNEARPQSEPISVSRASLTRCMRSSLSAPTSSWAAPEAELAALTDVH